MLKKQNIIFLKNRKIIKITGEDATDFLQSLITTDVKMIEAQKLLPGALLSPQGKVTADFLIGKIDQGYIIDIAESLADAFQRRLLMYKLQKKIDITKPLQEVITISWQTEISPYDFNLVFFDNRFPEKEKIVRIYGYTPPLIPEHDNDWHKIRIRYAITESSQDYEIGKVFPHDINYDQIDGVSFNKGCYIGQEIVSRMHHRRTARRRILIVKGQNLLMPRADIKAGNKVLGQLGTCVENEALVLMRIDHVKDAMTQEIPLTVNNHPVTVSIPENVNFSFP
ncbi:YgfZ/GcvT domain-containing protein [Bartonella ancashensis]|uniref:CAF17-like 4Fe-4S cluster assembly/insertion protein YgfZ n=1 Tax=Bartonella ancashensis TaxID=1318743 RepID=UPI0039E3AAF3